MPLPDPALVGYAPASVTNAIGTAEPPEYLRQYIGDYDRSRYYWNPDNMSLVDRYTGGSYGFGHITDQSLGTDVVTNYGNAAQNTLHYGAGQTPYFGFGDSAQGYNGGDAPNSGMFISADPNAIADYQSHRQDVVNRGVAQVGALVGGAALGGALSGPSGVTTASQSYTAPTAVGGASATAAPGTFGQAAFLPSASGTGAAGSAIASTPTLAGTAAGFLPKVGNFLSKYGDYVLPAINAGFGYVAADRASEAEVAAMDRALAENARQYDTTRADLMPWLTAGQGALNQLSNPTANFAASPDYDFRRSEGQRDIGNSFAARGMGQSGNALRALTEYNSSLASGEFNDFWNRQAGLAGVGQNTAVNLGGLGQNSANAAGNYFANQGASRASGVLGKYGAIGNAINDSYYNRLYRRTG